MIEDFLSKFNNNEYISNYLYEQVCVNNSSVIPIDFNIDEYNKNVLDELYVQNKQYFDNMYKGIDDNICLDEEQCKAILADEKYSLIIAGAGTGKTTTMVSKVKYLVDKKHADPKKILVMSYTRKATEEIANRIEENFGLPVHVTTFHSLGYEYVKEIFGKNRQCVILDRNKLREIQLNYFRKIFEDKSKIEEIIENFDIIKERRGFIFSKYFMDNYINYDTYDAFVDSYVNYKIEEARNLYGGFEKLINDFVEKQLLKESGIVSIEGEYVKSAGELVIANFLYTRGLDYSYEEVYDEIMANGSIYKPDFTVDYGGKKIYIEYFGLDNEKYNKIRKWKREFHKSHCNIYIEIDRLPLDKITEKIDKELTNIGVKYNAMSNEEIYDHILRLNPTSQVFPFLQFLHECMIKRKESSRRDDYSLAKNYVENYSDDNINKISTQYKYIMDYDKYYSKEAYGGSVYYFDFSDLLYYSVKHIEKLTFDTKIKFDYIIIDEYQDISEIKYMLTYKTAQRNDAKVYAVGDDWQSIFAFSGAKVEYICDFEDYFPGVKSFKISKTYRNSQELIDGTGEFIMKNEYQIQKQLISDKHISNPIVYKLFDSRYGLMEEIDCLKNTIKEIHQEHPDHNILVLGRTNKIIDSLTKNQDFIDGIGSKIIFRGNEDIQIDGMTMHKSKGLTYDEVILIGLNKRFPTTQTNTYWYFDLYKNEQKVEPIPFAEERRLFYVALTRTKNKVYLLVDVNENRRSDFVNEIYEIMNKK